MAAPGLSQFQGFTDQLADGNDDDDGMNLQPGKVITSKAKKYTVLEKLGQGGFGAVYKVEQDGKEYAMKVEQKMDTRIHSKLNMEVHLLKALDGISAGKNHFTKIFDRAKKPNYFMIVMTLVGCSLNERKRERPYRAFSLATGLGVSIQCLEAISQLHEIGFIHRDIKPANFACGRPPDTHLIYLLDFGIARKYTNDRGEVKGPRSQVRFKGTVRYASLQCHRGKELGPRDDCESWLYMLVDLVNRHSVPWRMDPDLKRVKQKKIESRTSAGKFRLFKPIGVATMGAIMDYIDSLKYEDKVDYEYIYKMVRQTGLLARVNIDGLYDWEKTTVEEATFSTTSKTARSK